MIALLLAAQVVAAPLSAEAPRGMPADIAAREPVQSFVLRAYPPTRRCQGAARVQTSVPAEPALLLRPQDRLGARKLKDMPPATGCLTASAEELFR
jgi:hypothetical protein